MYVYDILKIEKKERKNISHFYIQLKWKIIF